MASPKNGKRKSAKTSAAKKKPARTRAPKPAPAVAPIPSPDAVLGAIGATLTEKQRRFAHLYAADPNATAAYQQAFGNESRGAAKSEGFKLLQQPEIAEYVASLVQPRIEKVDAGAERTVKELAYCAFFDPAGLFDAKGDLLPIPQMAEEVRRVITGIEYKDGKPVKVRFVAKDRALELMGRYHKLFVDRLELRASESLEALLALSWSPAGGDHA